MSGAYWEMERRRLMGNRTWEIERYMALEYPRESVAAVLRADGSPPKRKTWGLRGARTGAAPATAGAAPTDA